MNFNRILITEHETKPRGLLWVSALATTLACKLIYWENCVVQIFKKYICICQKFVLFNPLSFVTIFYRFIFYYT